MKTTLLTVSDMISNLKVFDVLTTNDVATLETSLTDKIEHTVDKSITNQIVMQTVDEINAHTTSRFYAENKEQSAKDANFTMCELIPSMVVKIDVLTDDISFTNGVNKVPNLNRILSKSDKERIYADVQSYIYGEISKNEICRRIQSAFGIDTKVLHKEFRTVISDFCTKTSANTSKATWKKALNTSYIINAIGTALHLYHYRTKYTVSTNSLAVDIDYHIPAEPEKVLTSKAAKAIEKAKAAKAC